jgi:hypothetical protein
MSGEMYLMTPDLASFCWASDKLDRKRLAIRQEDRGYGQLCLFVTQRVWTTCFDWLDSHLAIGNERWVLDGKRKKYSRICFGGPITLRQLCLFLKIWITFGTYGGDSKLYTLLGDPNAVRFLSSSRLEASIGFITLCALLSTLYDDLYDLSPAANEAQGIVQLAVCLHLLVQYTRPGLLITNCDWESQTGFLTVGRETWFRKKLFRRMMGLQATTGKPKSPSVTRKQMDNNFRHTRTSPKVKRRESWHLRHVLEP